MTNGGLLQLVAYGAQDVYLTANPQVTFFKQLYRRHSNFAMESIEQTFNGVANFGKRVTCTIARNGDLIHKVYLQATLPSVSSDELANNNVPASTFEWVRGVGQALIKQVELEIGGQLIDRQYGEWLNIWNELTLPTGKQLNYNRMVNAIGGLIIKSAEGDSCSPCAQNAKCKVVAASEQVNAPYFDIDNDAGYDADQCPKSIDISQGCLPETTLYVPLEFWFCRHTGLALPLIALQYHEVKINLDFQELRYLVNVDADQGASNPGFVNYVNQKGLSAASLWVDYIYLDTEERRRFAQVAHEYLIEQLQYTGEESLTSTSNKIRLQFNHPVKELVWVTQNPSRKDCEAKTNAPFCFTDEECNNPTAVAKLQLNGQDRFQEREGSYFNFVQPYQHHTNSPKLGINVYSFALKPEDLQPSGTCNFSRIDNATMNVTLTPETFTVDPQTKISSVNFRIYATNYNVLRIMSGMGGLAYSN
jgi:hypothetical protein